MVLDEFLEQGFPKRTVLQLIGIPRSSYYYLPTGTKAGKKPSKYVWTNQETCHELEDVVNDIKILLEGEFVDYGYYKTYIYLRDNLGYKIGSSRTYKIMKEHNLLRFQRDKKQRSSRNWVKDLVPQPQTEFSFLEFDIKYVYIHGKRTNAQVLTVIDVFSRWNLGHYIGYSIRSEHVIELFEQLFEKYQLPKYFIVRNDNGSQFEADVVQKYLKEKGITQEFTKPATPQQNAHIESYHSIMESAVCQRIELESLDDFKEVMERFKAFYNFERIHGGIGHKSPYQFLKTKGVNMMDMNPVLKDN